MPCLAISMPKINTELKKRLAAELTSVFADCTGFSAEIFGIQFHEYNLEDAASGGQLCDDTERPFLHFLLYCPRITRSVKQKLVAELTNIFITVNGKPEWKPVIHICEHPYDNVGVDGKLLSDSYPECAKSKFYFDLPKD